MIPLSVFPFPSAPCRKRVVSYPIIAFCCRSFNLSVTASPLRRLRARTGLRLPASASLSLASRWPRPQQLLPVPATGGGRRCCFYRGEALAFRKALSLRQRLPYKGSCRGACDETERLDEGEPDLLAALLHKKRAGQLSGPLFVQKSCQKVRFSFVQPLSLVASSSTAPLVGEPLAKR